MQVNCFRMSGCSYSESLERVSEVKVMVMFSHLSQNTHWIQKLELGLPHHAPLSLPKTSLASAQAACQSADGMCWDPMVLCLPGLW